MLRDFSEKTGESGEPDGPQSGRVLQPLRTKLPGLGRDFSVTNPSFNGNPNLYPWQARSYRKYRFVERLPHVGDIATHRQIAEKIMPILHDPGDAIFFELGNWLTDMSQLRDPTSFISAKITIWNDSPTGSGLTNAKAYIHTLMGSPGSDGSLCQYFQRLAYVDGCERFRRQGVPTDQFASIFDDCWTQYYPHEHVDFPPWPIHDVIGERSLSFQAKHDCTVSPGKPSNGSSGGSSTGPTRKLLGYQEMQILYIAEILTSVDEKWRKLAADKPSDSNKKDLRRTLAKMGHASHAVEDFYFHSNFVEIACDLLHRGPGGADDTTRCRRIWYRRTRAPKSDDNTTLSKKDSIPGPGLVFTGSFGSTDVFHTMADALEGLSEKLAPKMLAARSLQQSIDAAGGIGKWTGPAIDRAYFLLDDTLGWLVFEERRQQLQNDDTRKAVVARHQARLQDGTYEKTITDLNNAGVLHSSSKDKLIEAMKIDRDLVNDPRWKQGLVNVPQELLGTYGFLMKMIAVGEKKHTDSEVKSTALDNDKKISVDPTDDGASAENIGSHSLMSKDSVRKLPLRGLAVNISCAVGCYIADTMVRQVQNRPRAVQRNDCSAAEAPPSEQVCTLDTRKPVDWLHLLQHFICHPDECESGWHVAALDNQAAPVDQSHTVKYIEPPDRDDRLKEQTRKDLEAKYKALEPQFEAEWRTIMP